MTAASDVLKYLNLFVDGRGHAGQIEEYSPPDLTVSTEEHRAGGMDAPIDIDMGLEKLTCSFVLTGYDRATIEMWGLKAGSGVPLTVKGSLESYDGTTTAVTHTMRGKITQLSRGTWGSGNKPSLTVTATLDYYRETHGGTVTTEIDAINMVRVIGGVDQLAEHRRNLGL
ncbi:phage major tail tube protein [Aliiroseovarius zhejiangensis]|uniref:Phage major tail tube protein n=1 Tax=Aliiroseovarius zhejiangensis TaxID=1632025 RepID=A0ABQ3ILX5_9RHOB|nr:phage major tail tube protein [Aliiroseovarius zhejiangensis]GHE88236.1 phage major tail tube protein [Aliiroseovarius zhejiangensis]